MNLNLISIHDIAELFREIRRKSASEISSRFNLSKKRSVVATWDRKEYPRKNWSAIERVCVYHSSLYSNDPNVDFYNYAVGKYLSAQQPLSGFSVGCGKGESELQLAEKWNFKQLVGIDLAPKSIAAANEIAHSKNLSGVSFIAKNILDMSFTDNHFDVAFALASLHHFKPVEDVIAAIHRFLKPGGLFVISEYVGPNRMQWKKNQLKIINKLLAEIPKQYRKRYGVSAIKNKVYRPGLLRMLLSDPSEGIESEKILPAIQKHFDTMELIKLGGTILHPLLHDIGANFRDDDPQANAIIDHLISVERSMLDSGELQSDFVLGIFGKP